jgi:hypothetical protein
LKVSFYLDSLNEILFRVNRVIYNEEKVIMLFVDHISTTASIPALHERDFNSRKDKCRDYTLAYKLDLFLAGWS